MRGRLAAALRRAADRLMPQPEPVEVEGEQVYRALLDYGRRTGRPLFTLPSCGGGVLPRG